MAQQHLNVGASPNDGTGDTLRASQIKAESNFTELYANKVDKAGTKVLSDNNFSDADKAKLDGLVGGTQADWNEGNNTLPSYINNKPTNVSEFSNDADYVADVGVVGNFVRSNGAWVSLETVSFPKIQITATAGQTVFPLGTMILAKAVFREGALLDDNDWNQVGTDITTTFPFSLGERFKPI